MSKDLVSVANATKYPLDAFLFVKRGLDFTVQRLHGSAKDKPAANRHVTGQNLCLGLRDYAIDQYGLMARHVLGRWQILGSEDFGHMVFAMVEAGLMHKTDEDSINDFIDVFDFNDSFSSNLQLSENL